VQRLDVADGDERRTAVNAAAERPTGRAAAIADDDHIVPAVDPLVGADRRRAAVAA
jgi:hypothetical protein